MPAAPEMEMHEYGFVEALPGGARALLDQDFFSSAAWYRTVVAAGLPAKGRAVFLVFSAAGGVAALFPMLLCGRSASSLSTPYTCLWRPLLAPGADTDAVWRGFAAWCRRWSVVRLDALDTDDAGAVIAGVAGRGVVPLRYDHFGNWSGDAEHGWAAYLAERPGALREAVRRRTKRFMGGGGVFDILRAPEEIEAGIAAYEAVYAKSWKDPEPYPAFNATLMRQAAAAGVLRLGVLRASGEVLAAQIWVVRGAWAAVLKLAHDEAARAQSPGTVLTALMIAQLIDNEDVRTLDFGRGDDAYKADWTTERRQREGVLLANPRTLGGLTALTRHAVGRLRQKANLQKFFASVFQERRPVLF